MFNRCLNVRYSTFAATAIVAALATTSRAAITWSPEHVIPTPPTAWNANTLAVIGSQGEGSVWVDGGTLSAHSIKLGHTTTGSGTLILTSGAQWSGVHSNSELIVGDYGHGELMIFSGARVLTTTGKVGANYNSDVSSLATVSGTNSRWAMSSHLYVGDRGIGELVVGGGGTVQTAANAYIGREWASSGSVLVEGGTFTVADVLFVGHTGTGNLNITQGGVVTAEDVGIAFEAVSQSAIRVSGAGSKLNVGYPAAGGELAIGTNGQARLTIVDGGEVNARDVAINNESMLVMDIGKGSKLNVTSLEGVAGSGNFHNNGTVKLYASALISAGSYNPISAETWTTGPSGKYRVIGGVWNSDFNRVDVNMALEFMSGGGGVGFNLNNTQRVIVTDGLSGQRLGISFTASDSDILMSAEKFGAEAIDALLATSGEDYITGWDISFDAGFWGGDEALVSIEIGEGFAIDDLNVWHFDGETWTLANIGEFTYDNGFASFIVTDFSGYAITQTAVPEPTSLALLAGSIGMLVMRRRK